MKKTLSNLSSMKEKQEYLVKYAYLNPEYRKNALRAEIRNCQDENLINFIFNFLQNYIMPFFDDYSMRTEFNKLRASFMGQVLSTLTCTHRDSDTFLSFYRQYPVWAALAGIVFNPKTEELYNIALSILQNEQKTFEAYLS